MVLVERDAGYGCRWIQEEGISKEVSFSAVQHERAPRSTSSLVGAARRGPSTIYPSISNVYHTTGNPYPLMYPALFPFKPSLPAFNTGIGKFFKHFIFHFSFIHMMENILVLFSTSMI